MVNDKFLEQVDSLLQEHGYEDWCIFYANPVTSIDEEEEWQGNGNVVSDDMIKYIEDTLVDLREYLQPKNRRKRKKTAFVAGR